jgi:hypothetical protein
MGAALNEGAAMLAGIAYLLERNPIALGLTVLLLLGIAARFPTLPKVEAWVENQGLAVAEKRRQQA